MRNLNHKCLGEKKDQPVFGENSPSKQERMSGICVGVRKIQTRAQGGFTGDSVSLKNHQHFRD